VGIIYECDKCHIQAKSKVTRVAFEPAGPEEQTLTIPLGYETEKFLCKNCSEKLRQWFREP
jgi:hypothetical protein